jgi:hypothetical protein
MYARRGAPCEPGLLRTRSGGSRRRLRSGGARDPPPRCTCGRALGITMGCLLRHPRCASPWLGVTAVREADGIERGGKGSPLAAPGQTWGGAGPRRRTSRFPAANSFAPGRARDQKRRMTGAAARTPDGGIFGIVRIRAKRRRSGRTDALPLRHNHPDSRTPGRLPPPTGRTERCSGIEALQIRHRDQHSHICGVDAKEAGGNQSVSQFHHTRNCARQHGLRAPATRETVDIGGDASKLAESLA